MIRSFVRRRGTASLLAAVAASLAATAPSRAWATSPGLVIDVTTLSGGKTADVSVGDVLTLKVYAVVTGADGTGANDGIQSAQGSFLSTGGMKGSLSGSLITPFNATS